MTAETIERIVACYAEQLADDPSRVDDQILRNCITDMARAVAGTVFLAAQHLVEIEDLTALSLSEQTKWAQRLDAHARAVAVDFGLKARHAVYPAGVAQEGTEIEDFASSAFLTALEELVRSTSSESGRA